MRKAPGLRQTEEYHSTYISPDLANEQQRNGKLLRDKMKLRTNNGEANLWIQRGKVVVRERRFSVNICTQLSHVQDNNHVNNWYTESRATDDIQGLLGLEGYTCYIRDRMSDYSTKGGGLLMYMKDTFDNRLLEHITVNRGIAALWCEIIIDDRKNDKVIIGLCYDSPSNDEEQCNMLYGDIYKAAWMNNCIIMGDFNK